MALGAGKSPNRTIFLVGSSPIRSAACARVRFGERRSHSWSRSRPYLTILARAAAHASFRSSRRSGFRPSINRDRSAYAVESRPRQRRAHQMDVHDGESQTQTESTGSPAHASFRSSRRSGFRPSINRDRRRMRLSTRGAPTKPCSGSFATLGRRSAWPPPRRDLRPKAPAFIRRVLFLHSALLMGWHARRAWRPQVAQARGAHLRACLLSGPSAA